jgi:SAM-dependent methyltransferase
MYAPVMNIANALLPSASRHQLRARMRRLWRPALLGTLRRTTPLSDRWGADRGTSVDRYFIEQFVAEHRGDIRGRVLEVRDRRYTTRFGVAVKHSDVLDIDRSNSEATIHADLAAAHEIPSSQFDCFIITQTLQFIYGTRAALAHAHRILRPGGALLVTVPSVSRMACKHDYWRFTGASCSELFGELFAPDHFTVRSYGNVLVCNAFLYGMAAEELSAGELETVDDRFPLLVAIRAVKG